MLVLYGRANVFDAHLPGIDRVTDTMAANTECELTIPSSRSESIKYEMGFMCVCKGTNA